MSQITSHRPAEEWLTDLQKAKVEGLTGIKPKISIQDLLERVNAGNPDADPSAPESQLIPTSPRSVEACFILGVDPIELQYHPLAHYRRNGEDDDIAQLRYEKCEAFRQEQIKSLIEERKRLIDEGWSGEPGKPAASAGKGGTGRKRSTETNAMVEKERQRLEVLKRRQEREMQQMVQHEVFRKEMLDKQTKKVQELERRAQELARQKAENDAAWISKQRELELQKLHEEKELEKEAKRMAEERYQREREMQRREQEEERRRKKEAYMKEMERRQKAEEARRETEAILAAQADEVMQRKMRMEELDSQRAKRLEQETKERALLNMDKRKKAEIRIQSAMETNAELLRRKREDFRRREQIAEERRQQLDELRRKEEERKREEERRKEKERHDKYLQALEQEEARKSFMRLRADEKDRMLAELYAMRKKENDIRRVEKEFELKLRLDKVDAIQKTNLYHRQQLLEKIMSEYDRTRSLMSQREKLQNERKMANMTASLQRHMMNQAMDQLKVKNKMGALSGPGGSLNLNDLVARRPATAM